MLKLVLAAILLLAQPIADVRAALPSAETARIRRHLATVEAELRAKDISALTPAQRLARARNLDVLHEYWVRGVFPMNTDFPRQRVPYFIDRSGTRCAMAYLIEQSGHADLVRRIATTQNNAYVRDLEDVAELGAWLSANGLTAAEAARIQPAYGSPEDDFAGRWEGKATFGSPDSITLWYTLTNDRSNDIWTITFPHLGPIQTRVVALAGDSIVTEAALVPSILGSGPGMTRLRTVLHYTGNMLTGSIEVRNASGAVVRGQTSATLDCPGPDSPDAVTVFVRRASVRMVRCITETGRAVRGGEWSVHQVTYRNMGQFRYARRTALLWDGRVGWIVSDAAGIDSNTVGMFRARRRLHDTTLTSPAFLKRMTTLGLRLRWAKTLLQDPDVPRFVPVALIAALHDTVDVPLAELLVSTPRVTRDPELLVALAHLPVVPDSSYRRADGGMVHTSARTGYAHARDAADLLLWGQSLAFIAGPDTPHDVLLTIATWRDRHAVMCPGRPSPSQVFPALKERASRERDTAILGALARITTQCR